MTDTTSDLFARCVNQAMTLDPDRIEAVIRNTAGGWPGGGQSEPVSGGGTSDPTASAAVRRLSSADPDYDLRDLAALELATDGYIASASRIIKLCSSAAKPEDWDEATKLGHLLHEQGQIQAAIDVGIDLTREVFRLHDYVTTVQRIHDGHCAHKADDTAKLATGDPICLSHARIGDYDRPRHGKHHVCKTCYDLLAAVGHPSELHHDPDAWPPDDLLREHAHMEMTGKRMDYIRERQRWVESHGPRERSA